MSDCHKTINKCRALNTTIKTTKATTTTTADTKHAQIAFEAPPQKKEKKNPTIIENKFKRSLHKARNGTYMRRWQYLCVYEGGKGIAGVGECNIDKPQNGQHSRARNVRLAPEQRRDATRRDVSIV